MPGRLSGSMPILAVVVLLALAVVVTLLLVVSAAMIIATAFDGRDDGDDGAADATPTPTPPSSLEVEVVVVHIIQSPWTDATSNSSEIVCSFCQH